MTMDLLTLRCNLIELHVWAQQQPCCPKVGDSSPFQDFVPNSKATRLYQKNHFAGHIWRWYWWAVSFSRGHDPIPEQVEATLQKIIAAFKHFQAEAIQDNQLYLDALFDFEGKEIYSVEDARILRSRIYNFYLATHAFWSLRNNPALSQIAQDTLSLIYDKLPVKPFLLSQNLIKLEALTSCPLPFGQIFKLSRGESLCHFEEQGLKHYLSRLRKPGIKLPFTKEKPPSYIVSVRFFHRVMREIISIINSKAPRSRKLNASLSKLEIGLYDLGFLLFEQEDPKHISWRKQLSGKSLKVDSKPILVGNLLGKKKVEKDRYLIYELTDKPNLVLKTGFNEAILAIDHETITRTQYGIRYTEYVFWDPKQRFVLVERITRSLKEISQHYVANPTIMRILYPVRDVIESLKNLYGTPYPMSPKQIGFNLKGLVRTFKHMKEQSYSPIHLEKFTYNCALKKQDLYIGLMLGTRLHSTSQVDFYASVLENVLEGSSFYLFWASLKHFEFNKELRAQADKFAKAILSKRKLCEEYLLDNYDIPDKEKLGKILNYAIKVYHRGNCIGSYLSPTFVPDICKKVVTILKTRTNPSAQGDDSSMPS